MTLTKKFCYSLSCLFPMLLGAQPSVISTTPSSGQGFVQTFTLLYSDAGGYANITSEQVNFSAPLSGANACYVSVSGNSIGLVTDAGTDWTQSTLGTPGGFVQNSQCRVDAAASSVSGSGNNLTLTLAITFSSSFAGTKTIYMNDADSGGGTGWLTEGTWTVGSPTVPSAVSVAPSAGSGLTKTFSFVFSDTGGYGNLSYAQIIINSTLNGSQACFVSYFPSNNQIELAGDTSGWYNATLGSGGTLSNSQCTVDATASSLSVSGNNLTLNVAITFSMAFAGTKNIYMIAGDTNGLQSSWLTAGTWTVATPSVPSVISTTPSSGQGLAQTFTLAYADSGGYGNLASAQVNFSSPLSGASACYVGYDQVGHWIVLLDDAGVSWTPSVVLGTAGGFARNSQCTVDAGASSYSSSGNNLTVTLAITFTPSFAGTKTIWMNSGDKNGSGTAWLNEGSWTVASNVLVSVSPAGPVTLSQSQTQQFNASVSGTTNTAVTWSRNPAVGTISASGLYTAPATISAAQPVTVTATSAADGSRYANASINLTPVQPDFTIITTGANPVSINQGGAAGMGVTVSSIGGFTGQISLSAGGLPVVGGVSTNYNFYYP
jgi:hypothetical protein